MIYAVILLILFALIYLGWEVFRVVRLNWRAFARFVDTLGKASDRMVGVKAPEIPSRSLETPHETRARIALKRECGREQRRTRTIERWGQNFHV